jgi:hypothetical protein
MLDGYFFLFGLLILYMIFSPIHPKTSSVNNLAKKKPKT